MKLKSILVFLALSLCAAAQTINGVVLTGDVSRPMILNNSTRPVLGWVLDVRNEDGALPSYFQLLLDPRTQPLAPGKSERAIGQALLPRKPITQAILAAVLFADGEFVGNVPAAFDEFTQRLGDFSKLGAAKDWAAIEKMAALDRPDNDPSKDHASLYNQWVASGYLSTHRAAHGQIEADNLALRYANLPSVWRKQ